jgi:multidrug resistance efflux pump
MLIVLGLYLILLWLLFSKLRLVRLNWISGSIAGLIGACILAVFLALLNHFTPSGKIVVAGRVVEITSNVTGEVIAIPVKPNVEVKAGTVLFQIDPTPFQFTVRKIEASLAQAQEQARQLKANYDQATATVAGLTAQVAYSTQRLADISKLTGEQAQSVFREQDTQIQYETFSAQLQAAKAAESSARIALDAEIGGENPTVANWKAQLDNAKWDLEQTTIRAPSDGYATLVTLTVGDRARQFSPVMSFVPTHDIIIIGMFSPNGFQTIKPGAAVTLVFDNNPGRRYHGKIIEIPMGVGQGQAQVSGVLARSGAVRGVSEFPATVSIPEDLDRNLLRLGMPGTATVFAEGAGAIRLVASIIIWIGSYVAYL